MPNKEYDSESIRMFNLGKANPLSYDDIINNKHNLKSLLGNCEMYAFGRTYDIIQQGKITFCQIGLYYTLYNLIECYMSLLTEYIVKVDGQEGEMIVCLEDKKYFYIPFSHIEARFVTGMTPELISVDCVSMIPIQNKVKS